MPADKQRNLRKPVRRPADNPQRVKNPGELYDFDQGEDLARAGY